MSVKVKRRTMTKIQLVTEPRRTARNLKDADPSAYLSAVNIIAHSTYMTRGAFMLGFGISSTKWLIASKPVKPKVL